MLRIQPVCTGGITRYVWSGDNLLWEMRGPGADSTFPGNLDDISDNRAEFGVVGYTHAGGVDRPLVVWKGMGANTAIVVVPHMNWRGIFGRGTNSSGGATTVAIEWPGFQTTAYHSVAPSQESTTNWMGSLIDGQRDPGGGMYMRNRYYDPATGQFTQTDPIGIAGGLNTYGFANGDPVSYSDPYGLRPMTDYERKVMADFCSRIDCDKVQVHDGSGDTKWENAARRAILDMSENRAVTLGYHIYIPDDDRDRDDVLAHELTHVWQYERGVQPNTTPVVVPRALERRRVVTRTGYLGRYHLPPTDSSITGWSSRARSSRTVLPEAWRHASSHRSRQDKPDAEDRSEVSRWCVSRWRLHTAT